MDTAASELRKKLLQQIRGVALQGFSEIIQGSPVDTGRFRSNWQASLGSRPTGEVETTPYQKNQPATLEEVQKINSELKGLGETESNIYFTNNLPYAEPLEKGHSSQNQGFVARAVRNMEKRFSVL
jgi:hypothetical protein